MAGTIITVKTQQGFTVLPNTTLRDNRLSLKTRALLAIMVSLPEDWDYTVSGLASVCGVGKDAVRTSLQELETCGYLTRTQRHSETGHFSQNEYIVTDTPGPGEAAQAPLPDDPSTDKPSTDEPSTDEPLTDNPTQQNKDCTNTPYNPPTPPEGGGDGRWVEDTMTSHSGGAGTAGPEARSDADGPKTRATPDWTLFDRFWDLYPKKKDKERARRAWRRLDPDLELCRVMSAALKRDRNSWTWRKQGGAFIPYPATWLNGRRWEDAPDPTPSAPPESGWAPDPEVM